MPARERPLRFGGGGELIGVLTEPARRDESLPGVVFINAGMIHRVGPNRLYVNLARHMADGGFVSTRFDLSGIGDSQHRQDGLPADESAVQETSAVMTALEHHVGLKTFVLVGLCSGAVTAFRTAVRDKRVVGMMLVNPQGFDHDPNWNGHVLSEGQARRYLRRALFSPDSWWRALSGRIDYRRLVRVVAGRFVGSPVAKAAAASVAEQLAGQFRLLAARDTSSLVVCSEDDVSVDYMRTILGADISRGYETGELILKMFPRSDHSMTLGASQRALFEAVDAWSAVLWRTHCAGRHK
jgi:hypothetical protein